MKWLTRLTVVAVFLLGAVAGTVFGVKVERERFLKMQRSGSTALTEQALKHISKEVKLKPEQQARLRSVLQSVQPYLTTAENERRAKILTIMESVRASVLAFLDAEQTPRYEQLHERLKKRLQPGNPGETATAAAAFGEW